MFGAVFLMSATAPIQNQIDLAHIFLVWQEEGT
jgi:hypothetical protein